jgi:hypothetical protein
MTKGRTAPPLQQCMLSGLARPCGELRSPARCIGQLLWCLVFDRGVDHLFHVFVVALAGVVSDLRPYRAVFFTFSSYEAKMRMTNNAMKSRYGKNENIIIEWNVLRRALDGFARLRNEVAHLVPMARSSTDPKAAANVRLVSPFWRSAFQEDDFDKLGYSIDELWEALRPYWGYHPRISLNPPNGEEAHQLAYRLQQFAMRLPPDAAPASSQTNP